MSDSATITGIAGLGEGSGLPISVTPGGRYSVNGSEFTSEPGRVWDRFEVRVAHISASGWGESTTTTLTIGNGQGTFTTITADRDIDPDAFAFEDRRDVDREASVISNAVTISGINDGVAIEVAGGAYSIDGAPFVTSLGTVRAGQSVRVTHYSASEFMATVTTTLTVGGISGTFSSTTHGDNEPDAFTFADKALVPRSTLITSTSAVITGLAVSAPITVTNGAYSVDGAPFTTAPGSISNGQAVRVQHMSSSQFSTPVDTVLDVGGATGTFRSITSAPDTTPGPFAFSSKTGVPRSALVSSEPVAISGIDAAASITVSNGAYSVDGGPFTATSGTIAPGQLVRAQLLSADGFSQPAEATVTIGGVSGTFSVTTVERDTVPDPFAFNGRTDVERGAEVVSDEIVVSGFNDATVIEAQKGKYSIDGGAFTNRSGTVTNGQRIRVRHNAASDFSTSKTSTLVIGGVAGTFTSTTLARDLLPDPFHFEDRSGALPRANVISNVVRISGINDVAPIAIQVEGGGSATGLLGAEAGYSINGSEFKSSAGSVQAGDSVTLRVRAPIEPGSTIRVQISIGEGSDTWDVTTAP